MNKLLSLAILVPALAACDQKTEAGGAATASSGTSTTSANASAAAKTAATSCDDVLANLTKLAGDKPDPDGVTLIKAMCNEATPAVRACMAAAKTEKEFDACDPHPLKNAMDKDKAAATPLSSADFVELDLSTADPAWKGWTAKGPKDAKVMADGVKGARIAANGMDAFDITFSSTKEKLVDMKKGAETGAKAGGGKVDFTTDSADKLVWSIENGGSKRYFFAKNMKVGGKDVGCATGAMGVAKEDDLKAYEDSCASLAKK